MSFRCDCDFLLKPIMVITPNGSVPIADIFNKPEIYDQMAGHVKYFNNIIDLLIHAKLFSIPLSLTGLLKNIIKVHFPKWQKKSNISYLVDKRLPAPIPDIRHLRLAYNSIVYDYPFYSEIVNNSFVIKKISGSWNNSEDLHLQSIFPPEEYVYNYRDMVTIIISKIRISEV